MWKHAPACLSLRVSLGVTSHLTFCTYADAVGVAVAFCVNRSQSTPQTFSFMARDAAGCAVDLEGGEYLISEPLIIPTYVSNMRVQSGSLVANPKSTAWKKNNSNSNSNSNSNHIVGVCSASTFPTPRSNEWCQALTVNPEPQSHSSAAACFQACCDLKDTCNTCTCCGFCHNQVCKAFAAACAMLITQPLATKAATFLLSTLPSCMCTDFGIVVVTPKRAMVCSDTAVRNHAACSTHQGLLHLQVVGVQSAAGTAWSRTSIHIHAGSVHSACAAYYRDILHGAIVGLHGAASCSGAAV